MSIARSVFTALASRGRGRAAIRLPDRGWSRLTPPPPPTGRVDAANDDDIDDDVNAETNAETMERMAREMLVEEIEMEERADLDQNASPTRLEARAAALRRAADELDHQAEAMHSKAHRRMRHRANEMARRASEGRDRARDCCERWRDAAARRATTTTATFAVEAKMIRDAFARVRCETYVASTRCVCALLKMMMRTK